MLKSSMGYEICSYQIKSSEKPFGLNEFDHVANQDFYYCCLLLKFTFEKGKSFRSIRITVFYVYNNATLTRIQYMQM